MFFGRMFIFIIMMKIFNNKKKALVRKKTRIRLHINALKGSLTTINNQNLG